PAATPVTFVFPRPIAARATTRPVRPAPRSRNARRSTAPATRRPAPTARPFARTTQLAVASLDHARRKPVSGPPAAQRRQEAPARRRPVPTARPRARPPPIAAAARARKKPAARRRNARQPRGPVSSPARRTATSATERRRLRPIYCA